jgi:hypothetical protein
MVAGGPPPIPERRRQTCRANEVRAVLAPLAKLAEVTAA